MNQNNILSSKEKLISLVKRGFIAGPDESEENFLSRIKEPSSIDPLADKSLEIFEKTFGIRPEGLSITFSKEGLRFWEGGYFDGMKMVLHPRLKEKKRLFGYTLNEILVHELTHAVRAEFNEPIFEEIMAYQSSESSFRRFAGALFRSPKESMIFLTTLLGVAFLSLFSLYFLLIALVMIISVILRGSAAQKKWKRCAMKCMEIVGEKRLKLFLLFLTDQEISDFATWQTAEIENYLKTKPSLRLEQLRALFF